MSTSADDLRLAIVEEDANGDIPASPSWEISRITSEDITMEPATTQSQELAGGGSRGPKDSIKAGAAVTGPLNWELSKNNAFEMLLAAALGSDWGSDPGLTPAPGADDVVDRSMLRRFAIEKRWQTDSAPTYRYHRYRNMIVDTLSMSVVPNEPVTGSFGFIGATREKDTIEVPSSSYTAGGTKEIFTAPLGAVRFYTYGTKTQLSWSAAACVTAWNKALTNNGRGISCIGTLGTKEQAHGRLGITFNGSIYYTGDDVITLADNSTIIAMGIILTDPDGNSYELHYPRCKFDTCKVVGQGTGQDVLNDVTMTALVDVAEGAPGYVCKITRVTV